MTVKFQLHGVAHLSILGATLLLPVVLTLIQRNLSSSTRFLRRVLAAILLLDTICWDAYLVRQGQLSFPAHLPIQLCDFTTYLTIVALLTLSPLIFDAAYYFALAGSSMALITPDLWEQFPSPATAQFFVAHGLVVVAILFLVWSRQLRPRTGSVARAMVAANLLALCDGVFDWTYKTNYMYLRARPGNASLLDLFGPWPWYIVATEGVALVLFLLLYLPWWGPRAFRQTALSEPAPRKNASLMFPPRSQRP